MKSGITFGFICLVFGLVLAACVPVTPVLPTSTVVPSKTATSTRWPTASMMPTPTNTIVSTQTPVFPIPTMRSSSWETPTPLATPVEMSSGFRLKTMNETQIAQLAAQMNEYSIANYPNYDDWWTRSQFESSQKAVALTIQEYLYQFPNSPNDEQYRWQLAFIRALSGPFYDGVNDDVDGWILSSFQQALNSGEVGPVELQVFLNRYWFDVVDLRSVENLFGDGKTAWYYHITSISWAEDRHPGKLDDPQNWGGEGLIFIIRPMQAGHFEIIPLKSAWYENETSLYEISDHNQNGIPEIAFYMGAHGGLMCSGYFLVYEWNSEMFIELTQGKILINDCASNFSYKLDGTTPAITVENFRNPKMIFSWDGQFYRFKDFSDATSLQTWLSFGDYDGPKTEEYLIREILNGQDISEMGPGFPDELRFRLGVVYALSGQRDEAVRQFQELIDAPADLTHNVFPKVAKRFLEFYREPSDIYRACAESNKLYGKLVRDCLKTSNFGQGDEAQYGSSKRK